MPSGLSLKYVVTANITLWHYVPPPQPSMARTHRPTEAAINRTMADREHQMSDATLVVAVARSDQGALSELYQRHGAAVLGFARKMVRSPALAEDVTQEIFLRLWNRPERFDAGRGSLRAFLLADTHGRSVDLIRSEEARRRREKGDASRSSKMVIGVEEEVEAIVESGAVRDALAELDESERRPIELAYFGGSTYRDVAIQLNTPEGTVKSRIRSGLEKLRAALDEAGLIEKV